MNPSDLNLDGIAHFRGLRIHLKPLLVKTETEMRKRTWKERLFTWPWRPLRTHKRVTVTVPDPNVYKIGDGLYMHPEIYNLFKERINEESHELHSL